jgi:hypothetical protein
VFIDDLIGSFEFKQRFCSLFNIEDLADVIKVLVDVDNEQPAIELIDFYSQSIDLIQHFLLIHEFLSETRSCHLQLVFSNMDFISVDSIRLSYRYQENIVRKMSSSLLLDSYIDESTRKFYILRKYEKYDSRHIDTMVNYMIADESARLKVSQYIRNLFKIYQDEGLQGLTKQRQDLSEQKVPKWVIPQIAKKESIPSSSSEEEDEDDTVSNEPITIPPEMLEAMKNEPGWQLPKSNINIMTDPNQSTSLTCYPPKAGAVRPIDSSDGNHSPQSKLQSTDAMKETGTVSRNAPITGEKNSSVSESPTGHTNNGSGQTDGNKNSVQRVPGQSDRHTNGENQN